MNDAAALLGKLQHDGDIERFKSFWGRKEIEGTELIYCENQPLTIRIFILLQKLNIARLSKNEFRTLRKCC